MAVIIAFTNQKGGVGKTTTTAALAAGLTKKKARVLSVDLDPQGNLGFSLGLNIEQAYCIFDVLSKQVSVKDAIQQTNHAGDIIVSNISSSQIEKTLNSSGKEQSLKDALMEVAHLYDYILIDTPPALNMLTINAYVAADYLIIPMSAEILSLVGVTQIKETIQAVRKSLNTRLAVLGILLTKYNRRLNIAKDVEELADRVAKQIETQLFETKIRSGVAASEAPAHGLSVVEYAPNSTVSIDYKSVIEVVRFRTR